MEQLKVKDLPAKDPIIARDLWILQESRIRLLEHAKECKNLDWTPNENISSAGDLLYHIALIEFDWLYAEIKAVPYPEEATKWFTKDARDDKGHLAQFRGETLEQYQTRLDYFRDQLLETYSAMSLEEYRHPKKLEHYEVTPEWALRHLTLHESHHTGQIAMLNSLMK